MTLQEKKERLTRLNKRILRLQTLLTHNMTYEENKTGNKYDDVFLNVLDKMRPVFHVKMLALEYQKIQATKTNG